MPTQQTAIQKLPWPEGLDPASFGDNVIRQLAEALDLRLPYPGDLKPSLQAADHGLWKFCDGRGLVTGAGGTGAAVLKSSLPAAFVALLVASGYEVDATHVAYPDYRGRTVFGVGTHADVNALTDSDGSSVGSRTPRHSHSISADGAHDHGFVADSPGTSADGTHNHGNTSGGSDSSYVYANNSLLAGQTEFILANGTLGGLGSDHHHGTFDSGLHSHIVNPHSHGFSAAGTHSHGAATGQTVSPYGVANWFVYIGI